MFTSSLLLYLRTFPSCALLQSDVSWTKPSRPCSGRAVGRATAVLLRVLRSLDRSFASASARASMAGRNAAARGWNHEKSAKDHLWALLAQNERESDALRNAAENAAKRKEQLEREVLEEETKLEDEQEKNKELQVELGGLQAELRSLQDAERQAQQELQTEEEKGEEWQKEIDKLQDETERIRNDFLARSRHAVAELDSLVFEAMKLN